LLYVGDLRYEGWLSPTTHEIVESPNEVDCPPPPFYLETKSGQLFLLDNRTATAVNDMEYLVNPGDAAKIGQLAEISFAPGGVYFLEDITGRKKMLGLMQSMSEYNAIDRGVARIQTGGTLRPKEWSALNTLFDFNTEGLYNLVYGLAIGLACVAAGVIAIAIAIYIQPIKDFVMFAYKIIGRVFRCYRFFIRKTDIVAAAAPEPVEMQPKSTIIDIPEEHQSPYFDGSKEQKRLPAQGVEKKRNVSTLPDDIRQSEIYPGLPTAPLE
jgi:hypothetical protein